MASAEVIGERGRSFTNWSKTFTCKPQQYFTPKNEEELIKILKQAASCNKKVKAIGCGNSPSDIMFTDDYLISMKYFNQLIEVDEKNSTVVVQSGATVAMLNEQYLPKHNLALSVAGSVPHISIGGAISTGTHGSGINYGNLASYVLELDLVLASGEKMHCSRQQNADIFRAACCGIGALAIITTIKLQCEPAFRLEQTTYPAPLEQVLEHLKVHQTSSDHFRFMWYPNTDQAVISHVSRTKKPCLQLPLVTKLNDWFWNYLIGFYLLELFLLLSSYWPQKLTSWLNMLFYQLTFCRQAHAIDDSYKIFSFECLFKQYVNEWAIPAEKCSVVLMRIKDWLYNTKGAYIHFPVEVRFVKQDDLYLSPASGMDVCYVNIVMYRPYGTDIPHKKFWKVFEDIVKSEGGRPHWAKAHHEIYEDFQKMYPKWTEWCNIRKRLDPNGLFANAYLHRILQDKLD